MKFTKTSRRLFRKRPAHGIRFNIRSYFSKDSVGCRRHPFPRKLPGASTNNDLICSHWIQALPFNWAVGTEICSLWRQDYFQDFKSDQVEIFTVKSIRD